MILRGRTLVLVPWFDSDGMKQWLRLQFTGSIDKRGLYKKCIRYIKDEFNKSVDKRWLKLHCLFMNEHDPDSPTKISKTQLNNYIETWIKGLETDEDEDDSDSVLSEGDYETPAPQVLSVPNYPR